MVGECQSSWTASRYSTPSHTCCIAATAEKGLGDPVDTKPMAPDLASVLAAAQARAKKAAVVAAQTSFGKGQVYVHESATKQWQRKQYLKRSNNPMVLCHIGISTLHHMEIEHITCVVKNLYLKYIHNVSCHGHFMHGTLTLKGYPLGRTFVIIDDFGSWWRLPGFDETKGLEDSSASQG